MCKYQPIHCTLCGVFMNDYQLYGRECPHKGDRSRCQPRMVDIWALKGKCGGGFCENSFGGEMDEDEYGFEREQEAEAEAEAEPEPKPERGHGHGNGNGNGNGLAEGGGGLRNVGDLRAGGPGEMEVPHAVLVNGGDMGDAQETQSNGVERTWVLHGEGRSNGSGNRNGVEMETSIDVIVSNSTSF